MGEVTVLLNLWSNGSKEAESELFRLLNPDLRRLAHFVMRGERVGHSLQATELVGQIYIKLLGTQDRQWQNRQHFFAVIAKAMRWHLIDLARARPNGERRVDMEKLEHALPAQSLHLKDILVVGELLTDLEKEQPEWCRVVEMKYFLGMTDEEVAAETGASLRKVQRMWHNARKWLFERLGPDGRNNGPGG
jgi:RNA polymerase sigma-70 factor, ECF subfamily